MHILEHAHAIIGRGQAEQFLCGLIPGLRQVLHRQGAGEQFLFDLEAQDDVQVVSDFV